MVFDRHILATTNGEMLQGGYPIIQDMRDQGDAADGSIAKIQTLQYRRLWYDIPHE